jgi:hypothetical protein
METLGGKPSEAGVRRVGVSEVDEAGGSKARGGGEERHVCQVGSSGPGDARAWEHGSMGAWDAVSCWQRAWAWYLRSWQPFICGTAGGAGAEPIERVEAGLGL